jgi:hypothetical protein
MYKERLETERMIYEVMDILDKSTGCDNKSFWMDKLGGMSDAQFKAYISKPFPFFYQVGAFKEPSMNDIIKALDHIGVPLLEEVYMPFKYKDKDGNPVKSQKCLVIYPCDKRMKQIITKKNKVSLDNSMRDMRTGQLTGASKGGRNSDHEVEAATLSGLDNLLKELSRPRGDAMVDKEIMNNTIKTLGQVSLADLPDDPTDSLGKNNLSMMFIGAQLYTNLVNEDYLLPYTLKMRDRKVERVD